VPRQLPSYILRVILRLGRYKVNDDGLLVMGQGLEIFSTETMFRSLFNIISGGRSFSPQQSFFYYDLSIFLSVLSLQYVKPCLFFLISTI
jgi:hypothetical protein